MVRQCVGAAGTADEDEFGGERSYARQLLKVLKPVLVEIGATCPSAGLFLLDSEWDTGETLEGWLRLAGPQVAATVRAFSQDARATLP